MNERSSKKRKWNLEIPIVITIAGLMLVLINFSDKKLDELIVSDAEVLFMDIDHDPNDQMHADLAERVAEFRPDTYKMIEVYDKSLNEVVSIDFNESESDIKESIHDYPELVNLLMNNSDGHTSIDVDDSTEYIYFRWSYDDNGTPYLFIIYTYKPIVKYFWVFHLICYTILFMICTLLMRLSLKSHSDKIRYYNEISNIEDSRYHKAP